MNFLQIDLENGGELDGYFGFQARTAYLFADITNIVGHSTFLITFDYVVKNLKVSQMCEIAYRNPKTDPELLGVVDSYLNMEKQMKSFKHAPNHLFISFKRFENNLKIILKDWMNTISALSKSSGYAGIFELYKEDSFVFFHPDPTGDMKIRTYIKVLDVLNNTAPFNTVDKSIWLMPFLFYSTDIFEEDVITEVDLIEENKPYLIKSLQLNNFNFLSSPELTSVKFDMQLNIQPFRTAMETWALQCHKGPNGVSSFKEAVVPTLKDTQQAIANNPILQHLRSIEAGQIVINLYIGEVTPLMLWKFYTRNQLITPEQLTELTDAYLLQPPRTIPVIFFLHEHMKLGRIDFDKVQAQIDEPINTDIEITSTRKYIDID